MSDQNRTYNNTLTTLPPHLKMTNEEAAGLLRGVREELAAHNKHVARVVLVEKVVAYGLFIAYAIYLFSEVRT